MVSADVIIVDVIVLHGGVAHRAVGPVVVNACGRVLVRGAAVQAEPLHPLMPPSQAAGEGIVSVENQLRLRVDRRNKGIVNPLRVAVASQLVPIEVRDHELRGVEILEAAGGVPLVGLNEEHVRLDLPPQRGVGQHQGRDALNLVGALFIVDHALAVRPQNRGNHLHRGGLAVGAGDGDHPGWQRHPAQNIRAELQGVFPRQAATLAHQLACKPQQLARHNGQKHSHKVSSPETAVS